MTIIVTGGAGFIGSNFIYFQLKNHPEDRIVCLDSLTYAGNMATLDEAMKNDHFRFVKADITDKAAVEKLFQEEHPDIIVNFAAESHVDRSIRNPEVFVQTNVLGQWADVNTYGGDAVQFTQKNGVTATYYAYRTDVFTAAGTAVYRIL